MNLRNRLAKEIAVHGLTQTELSEMSGVTQGCISHILSGRTKGTKSIEKIANALNVDKDYLLYGKEKPLAINLTTNDIAAILINESANFKRKYLRLLEIAEEITKI